MSRQPVLGTAALQHPATQRLNINEDTCRNLSMFKDVMSQYRKLDDTVTMQINRNGALFREAARRSPSSASEDENKACLYLWKQLVANWKSRTEIVDYCCAVLDNQLAAKEQRLRSVIQDGPSSSTSSSDFSNAPNSSTSNQALFHPRFADAEPWRGPASDFYRPKNGDEYYSPSTTFYDKQKKDGTPNPEKEGDSELDGRDRYQLERRQRERENDARNALWEEKAKKDQIENEKTVEAIVRKRSYDAFRGRCKFFAPPAEEKEAKWWWDHVANSRNSRV